MSKHDENENTLPSFSRIHSQIGHKRALELTALDKYDDDDDIAAMTLLNILLSIMKNKTCTDAAMESIFLLFKKASVTSKSQ